MKHTNFDTIGDLDADERNRLKEVARRLDRIFQRHLSLAECKALSAHLSCHTFFMRDGFIINGDDEGSLLGKRDAAAIVGCLHGGDERHDADWWYGKLLNTDCPDPSVYHCILGQIAGHPSVESTR